MKTERREKGEWEKNTQNAAGNILDRLIDQSGVKSEAVDGTGRDMRHAI